MQIEYGGLRRFMIKFNENNGFYKSPFGSIEERTQMTLRIKIMKNHLAETAQVVFLHEEKNEYLTKDGRLEEEKEGMLQILFSIQLDQIGFYLYHFEVTDKNGEVEKTEPIPLLVYQSSYQTPPWLKNGLMYQIFPDRFAKSQAYECPTQSKNMVLRDDWGGIPNGQPDENGIVQNNDFFSGNLQGIIEKLDYLQDLGVSVIYLNPIFESYSNHRYDTGNYKKIDPLLGREADFIELCQKSREKGIRILLDGVFNHTGSDSLYFNKNGRYEEVGAYQSKSSLYYNWYHFIEYPDQYESWWGINTLPHVNELEPSYLDYMIRNEDSVVKHWMRLGASGFRLDVADELPNQFLEELRIAVKSINPDGAVIGEVWEDAVTKIAYEKRRQYFWGKQLDSVMNYPLKDAIIDYLVYDKDGVALERKINCLWEHYPKPAFQSMMNILGTHDTPRILSVLSDNSWGDEYSRQRLFLAMLILSFMPGIPSIYYGDEIGMRGGKDPLNRMCFDQTKGDSYILLFIKKLFRFRKKIQQLGEFEYKPRTSEGGFYSFQRILETDRIVIAVNAGNQDHLLNLAMKDKESIKDFFISGSVTFERQGVFRIKENSGIAIHISCM